MGYSVQEIETLKDGKIFYFELISINAKKSCVRGLYGPKMNFLFSVFIDVSWVVEHEYRG